MRIVNVAATLIIVAAFLVLLRTVFTPAGEIPTIGGYGFMRTLTGSMEPEIPTRSFIVVQQVDPNELAVGDVITFHSADEALEGSLNTHRITAIVEQNGQTMYRTKGDANAAEDANLVPQSSVVGRVVFVSAGLGVVVSLFTNPLLFFPFIVVPLIILVVIEISKLVKSTREVAQAEEEEALRQTVALLQKKKAAERAAKEQAETPENPDEGDAESDEQASKGPADSSAAND